MIEHSKYLLFDLLLYTTTALKRLFVRQYCYSNCNYEDIAQTFLKSAKTSANKTNSQINTRHQTHDLFIKNHHYLCIYVLYSIVVLNHQPLNMFMLYCICSFMIMQGTLVFGNSMKLLVRCCSYTFVHTWEPKGVKRKIESWDQKCIYFSL